MTQLTVKSSWTPNIPPPFDPPDQPGPDEPNPGPYDDPIEPEPVPDWDTEDC
jgi:hypothetical protein